jgi:hypothetical protein
LHAGEKSTVIRTRRKKKKREVEQQHRTQVRIILGGAILAAVLAAIIPGSCNPPVPLDSELRDQLEDLAKDAESRDRSKR